MKGVKKKALLAAIVSVPFIVYSCGESSDSSQSNNNTTVSTLSLSVDFKKAGEVSSQYLNQNAQCVHYSLYPEGQYTPIEEGIITPDNPSVSITIPTANYYLNITVTDAESSDGTYCSGNTLDYVQSYVSLVEGSNTFTLYMIGSSKWEFVDSSNNPSPIVLNKLVSQNAEVLNYFLTTPGYYYYYDGYYDYYTAASIDTNRPIGYSSHIVVWKGENFTVNNDCPDSQTCYTQGNYAVQFIGPNTSLNAFETNSVEDLQPYVDSDNEVWNRNFFIFGAPAGYDFYNAYYGYYGSYYGYDYSFNMTVSQNDGTDVLADMESRFNYTSLVSSDTMEGAILEVATKQSTYTENYVCSWDPEGTDTFTCPTQITATGIKAAAAAKILSSGSISSQAIDSNNCYMNAKLDEAYSYRTESGFYASCDFVDINNDGVSEWVCDYNLDGKINVEGDDTNNDGTIDWEDSKPFYVNATITGDLHICVYPFRAKAQEIPESDLNILIQ